MASSSSLHSFIITATEKGDDAILDRFFPDRDSSFFSSNEDAVLEELLEELLEKLLEELLETLLEKLFEALLETDDSFLIGIDIVEEDPV
jgi:hypothetical protein